jgi:hypothetical protein
MKKFIIVESNVITRIVVAKSRDVIALKTSESVHELKPGRYYKIGDKYNTVPFWTRVGRALGLSKKELPKE